MFSFLCFKLYGLPIYWCRSFTLIKLYIVYFESECLNNICLTTDPITHYDMKCDEEMILLNMCIIYIYLSMSIVNFLEEL